MYSFDLHAHPSIKASLTRAANKKTPWDYIQVYIRVLGFHETLESQSNLEQLTKGKVNLCVNALSGIERAFAESFVLRKLLASEIVSDLDRNIFTGIINGSKTYFDLFMNDLKEIEGSNVHIASNFSDIHEDKLNILLAVEGAHSFQDGDKKTIVPNLLACKKKYRFLYLTLTHLNQEPASVHCFGTKIQILKWDVNITPNVLFRPDATKMGISSLGYDIIKAAYDKSTYVLPIDVKHMSYVSREQFYKLRVKNGWEKIPIIASHCGVAGGRMSDAEIIRWKYDPVSGCQLVRWKDKKTDSGTKFNPWTISLYDEDIEAIIASRGLIGISLDQRVLGYGKIYGEYLNPKELEHIRTTQHIKITNSLLEVALEEPTINGNMVPEIVELMEEEQKILDEIPLEAHTYDVLFETGLERDGYGPIIKGESHVDYFSCNVLHVIKVGFKKGYDGGNGRPDVRKCVCIGSDLDGMVDSINFPAIEGDISINKDNYVVADEYPQLRREFEISFKRCYDNDSYFKANPVDLSGFTEMFFYSNGYNFLKEHFK